MKGIGPNEIFFSFPLCKWIPESPLSLTGISYFFFLRFGRIRALRGN
jgi:hypothetical protein